MCQRNHLVFAIILFQGILLGQNLTVCDGINHVNPGPGLTNQTLANGSEVAVLYTAPANTGIEFTNPQFRFGAPTAGAPGAGGVIAISASQGTIRIHTVDPISGLPTGTVLASGTFGPNSGGTGPIAVGVTWNGPVFTTPVNIPAGGSVWVVYTRQPYTGQPILQLAPNGPNTVTSSINTGGGFGAPVLTDSYRVRLRSTNCNPSGAGYPTWTTVGSGCTGQLGTPDLIPNGLPTLGNGSIALNIVNGPPGQIAYLFWSIGATTGGGLPLGSGCTLWLDYASFNQFLVLGLNPLQTTLLDNNGLGTFPLAVPADIGLVSVPFGFQVAMGDWLAPLGYVVSEAEVATIGF